MQLRSRPKQDDLLDWIQIRPEHVGAAGRNMSIRLKLMLMLSLLPVFDHGDVCKMILKLLFIVRPEVENKLVISLLTLTHRVT